MSKGGFCDHGRFSEILTQCIKLGSGDWRTHWAVGKAFQRKRYLSDTPALLPGRRGRQVWADCRARSRQEGGPGPEGPGGHLQAGSRGVGEGGGHKRTWDGRRPGVRPLQPRPHLVHGGQDPAVAPAQGTDLSHLPGGIVGEAELHELALRGRGHGQTPPQPRRPDPETGTLGVGSVPCSAPGQPWSLCSLGTNRPGWGVAGRPHLLVQLVAGTQRLFHRRAVVRRVQIEEVDPGALQPLEGRLQLGPEAVRLQ